MRKLLPYCIGACWLAVVSAGLWLPKSATAQQPAPVPEYTITLNGQEWFQIGEALAERPFKVSNPILAKINQQITAIAMQRQKEEAEAAKPKTALPPDAATKPEERRDVNGNLVDKSEK